MRTLLFLFLLSAGYSFAQDPATIAGQICRAKPRLIGLGESAHNDDGQHLYKLALLEEIQKQDTVNALFFESPFTDAVLALLEHKPYSYFVYPFWKTKALYPGLSGFIEKHRIIAAGIDPQEISNKLGSEIIRLWVAASDYSGDIAGDDKILARVVDAYRRIRNTLRFLLANTSDFDIEKDGVPLDQLFEIDRYALSRAAQFQAEILAHYKVYEFHPVVAKLQIYCSEDLGGFYLDILKDRLYTTAPGSLARRSAQTALWHISQAMLRWMAPFLSFTAEEAWKFVGTGKPGESIFTQTYSKFDAPDEALLAKWNRIREIRDVVNKDIEAVRAEGKVGSSLQANLQLTAPADDFALLGSLGEDLKFVFITSAIALAAGEALSTVVTPSAAQKCERCWHYRDDVGHDAAHPTICGRCTSNLFGAGESRSFA